MTSTAPDPPTAQDIAMANDTTMEEDVAFDDALNRLMGGIARPKDETDVQQLQEIMSKLLNLCKDDPTKWKSLVLALTYERYHIKAPQAKISLKEAATSDVVAQDDKATVGNGERRIFYVAMAQLFQTLLDAAEDNAGLVSLALQCLLEIAPYAGGSRDVCAIIEKFVGAAMLPALAEKRQQVRDYFGEESLSLLVAHGVKYCMDGLQQQDAKTALDSILQLAADTLEDDKQILEARKEETDASKKDLLPSTIHVFLPHRDRGKPGKNKPKNAKKVPDRQWVNSVAEILIWTRCSSLLSSNKAFVGSYTRLLEAGSGGISKENKEKLKSALTTLQTIIRKERQKFNEFARTQGFMLSDLFQLDQSALKYRHICSAKDGDMTKLTQLAKKKNSSDVLRLINARFASNPAKITRFESVREVVREFKPPAAEDDADEVAQLEHQIQVARLKATIRHLRKAFKKPEGRQVVLASLDSTVDSHTAALLVAAALGTWEFDNKEDDKKQKDSAKTPKDADGDVSMVDAGTVGCQLHLPGGVVHDVNSFEKVCNLLQSFIQKDPEVFPSMAESDGSATIKAVVNLMEKHLLTEAKQTLLVFSSTDLKLPTETAEKMIKQDCAIHCHDVDDIQHRLKREGARRGDITISLSWDTHDDLDLHVVIPTGERIHYSHKVSEKGRAMLDVDMNAGSPYSNAPVENVFVGDADKKEEAPHGKYKVIVNNYAYHAKGATKGTPVAWRVVIDKNGAKEHFSGSCVGDGKASDVEVCEFEYKGRTVPFPGDDLASKDTAASVNITTSIGQTLEALTSAIKAVGQQEQMNQARQLVDVDDEEEEAAAETEEPAPEEETKEAEEMVSDEKKEEAEAPRPIVSAKYEVTNRDRNRILIFNLPPRFHGVVNKAFGGGDLAEQCAESLAKRMVQDKIPLSELKRAGYPNDIVKSVKAKMKVV